MSTKILVPDLSESVSEATVGRWLKAEGAPVREGEPVVELETDKVDLEVGAEAEGVLARIEKGEGETVVSGDVLGVIDEPRAEEGAREPESRAEAPRQEVKTPPREEPAEETAEGPGRPEPEEPAPAAEPERPDQEEEPAARVDEPPEPERRERPRAPVPRPRKPEAGEERRPEHRERLSTRRRTIARRLVEAQNNAAILTTFNDADMSSVMTLRERYGAEFERRHGVRLGIVSFFAKASVAALKEFPQINAELSGDELVLKRYYDIGIAVAAPGGLVVPVLRDCDRMSLGEMEKRTHDLARRARDGSLGIEDLRGGTFTISNGGVFGSLWSTPILNPPQVGILGLHRIEDRPIARNGAVVVRPMMYLALSYDHRVADGAEAVGFLRRVKHLVENPETLLFEA